MGCYMAARKANTLPPLVRKTRYQLLEAARVGRTASECWPWPGNISPSTGYGRIRVAGQLMGAHQWVYQEFVGPVAGDTNIDHTCHTRDLACPGGISCPHRRCVNYENHLEVVTPYENWKRGKSPSLLNSRKNTCPQGHSYESLSLTTRDGAVRRCRTCTNESNRRGRARRQ